MSIPRRIIMWVLSILAVLFILGLISTWVNDEYAEIGREQNRAEAFETGYMKGCDNGEYTGDNFNQTEYCKCTYAKIVDGVGIKQLGKDALNLTQDQMAHKYDAEMVACIKEQGIAK